MTKKIVLRIGDDEIPAISLTVRDDSAQIEDLCEIVLKILNEILKYKRSDKDGVEVV